MATRNRIRPRSDRGNPIDFEAQRRRLFGAQAVVTCCRHALDSHIEGLDKQSVIDALQVAGDIIEDVAGAIGGGTKPKEEALTRPQP